MKYVVYVLQSQSSRRYYVGMTNNLAERLNRHNSNRNTSTRYRGPWVVVYDEVVATSLLARSREKFLKSGAGRKLVQELIMRGGPAKQHGG